MPNLQGDCNNVEDNTSEERHFFKYFQWIEGPMMPCLKEEFRAWLRRFAKPYRYIDSVEESKLDLSYLYTDSGVYMAFIYGEEYWEFAFEEMSKHLPNELRKFVEVSTQRFSIFVDVFSKRKVPISALKVQDKDCSRCTLQGDFGLYCVSSSVITHRELSSFKSRYVNYTFSKTYCDVTLELPDIINKNRMLGVLIQT
ncbi:hypothetical protein AB4407_17745 [Vibrio sp. 10N.261.46.E11]|uniref:hypothetical protein n=1 Tax=Vibrio sp. 10N.261.46.E11 TaxID=3229662 RepID=UPI0035514763